MTEVHPNAALLQKFDPANLDGAAEVFSEDVVWHFFNPRLPDVEGDYVGVDGIRAFFEKMKAVTGGTFEVQPVSTTPCGDELLVVQTRNTMKLGSMSVAVDVVTVWRVVDGRIAEVWDIPSVHTMSESAAD